MTSYVRPLIQNVYKVTPGSRSLTPRALIFEVYYSSSFRILADLRHHDSLPLPPAACKTVRSWPFKNFSSFFFRTNRRSQCYLLRHAHAWAYGTSRRGKQGDVSPQWAPCWHDRLARRPWDPWRSASQVRRVCLPTCLRSMIRLLVARAGQWLSQAIASLQYRSFLALRTCCIGGGRRGGLGEWERWIGHFCRSF